MPGEPAAKERQPRIDEPKMKPASDQVVNQDRVTTNSQPFPHESAQLLSLQMVRKQRAAHDVERSITKWQRQGVARHRSGSVSRQVRPHEVEERHLDANTFAGEQPSRTQRCVATSSSNFQQRQLRASPALGNLLDQRYCRPCPAKPVIDVAQVCQAGSDFIGRAKIVVQQFGYDFTSHAREFLPQLLFLRARRTGTLLPTDGIAGLTIGLVKKAVVRQLSAIGHQRIRYFPLSRCFRPGCICLDVYLLVNKNKRLIRRNAGRLAGPKPGEQRACSTVTAAMHRDCSSAGSHFFYCPYR
jgi:hypothetical protein